MNSFLSNNRDDLIARCKEKVARRPTRRATAAQLAHGIPLFLDQLIRTLSAEERGEPEESLRISGAAGGDAAGLSEMGMSAAVHGKELLQLGYSIDAVVHDYGDLCQSITDLAVERDAPFSVSEFRTLNRCLDNAIADAVTNFAVERDARVARSSLADENERLGALVHELRNVLQTATLAFRAIESGAVGVSGTTSDVLRRSLASLSAMLDKALWEVRLAAEMPFGDHPISVAAFIAEATRAASFSAQERNCTLEASIVDPLLEIAGDRERLMGALLNLLQNAFKFTRPGTDVALSARADGDQVLIEVADHCGGLPANAAQTMFKPFAQVGADRSGVGLGLMIARRSVEAGGGQLTVRDIPGNGCVFSIRLPRWIEVLRPTAREHKGAGTADAPCGAGQGLALGSVSAGLKWAAPSLGKDAPRPPPGSESRRVVEGSKRSSVATEPSIAAGSADGYRGHQRGR